MTKHGDYDGCQHMEECFLCRRDFQFGPHRFAGRGIERWRIKICLVCLSSNHDGVVLEQHPRLRAHLKQEGVIIVYNAKGWLEIPS